MTEHGENNIYEEICGKYQEKWKTSRNAPYCIDSGTEILQAQRVMKKTSPPADQ